MPVERRAGVLAVPTRALIVSGDASAGLVIEDERLVRRQVVPGLRHQDWTEIVEGLRPGDLVVASNPALLREGTPVRVVERITRAAEGAG